MNEDRAAQVPAGPVQGLGERPLTGVTVVDLTQVYQGPYATFLLAKAGANVIKIEPPAGEPGRQRAQVNRGASLPFEMLNVNKKGLALNLKTARGVEILKELCRRSDVLVENFAPGVLDRLGVGWEVLRAVNPSLIYASATGFGLTGPDRDNLAMDLTIQAVSGIMACTGMPDGPPLKAGPAIVDFLGGTHLYAGIVTALVGRARTGRGSLVEISMQETVYPTLASTLGLLYEGEDVAVTRTGNRHSGLSQAPYNVYRAADGYVAIICVTESHWANLLRAIGRTDLLGDPRFTTHAARVAHLEETDALVEQWTAVRMRRQIVEALQAAHVPSAPVREVREVISDPHMRERGMLQRLDHPRLGDVVLPNSPIRLHDVDPLETIVAPDLGQHSHEILVDWLGFSEDDVVELRHQGVI